MKDCPGQAPAEQATRETVGERFQGQLLGDVQIQTQARVAHQLDGPL